MKRLSLILALGASLVLAATALAASPPYLGKATGGITMSNPLQYASFSAFDYGPSGDKGTVEYTNFKLANPGTGVWRLVEQTTVTFQYGGLWTHTFVVDSITPTTPHSMTFTGHGQYDPSYTWTMTGSIDGSNIAFTLDYTGAEAYYLLWAEGTIAANGSISGTSTDNYSAGARTLPWTMPAGSAYEVFSYTAKVDCATYGDPFVFGFTIPSGVIYAGTHVVVNVHDGGTPGTNGDTWMHNVGPCGLIGATNYPITSGNLVIH